MTQPSDYALMISDLRDGNELPPRRRLKEFLMHLSIVLPCHNEAAALPTFIPRLKAVKTQLEAMGHNCEIIVVDDGSSDSSPSLLQNESDIKLIRLNSCKGYGAALKTGFRAASGEVLAFMDCDNTYFPEDLPILYAELINSNADIVMGYRPFFGSGMPLLRAMGNALFVGLARVLFNQKIRDCSTGFRIFKRSLLPHVLNLPTCGFNFSMQLTLFCLVSSHCWRQVAIRYNHRLGDSKLSVLRDGIQYLYLMLKYRWQN